MAKDIDKGQMRSGENIPGPDVMLGMWASWMDQMAATGQASAGQGKPWWQMTTDAPAPDALAGGVQQLEEVLRKDPTLRSIDQMWNANPLREVIPIDWAEIARALRIVWLRSLRKPETAKAIVDFNTDLWRSALQVWHEAGQRWLGSFQQHADTRAGIHHGRQAVRRARVASQPGLPHAQGGLSPRFGLAAETRRRDGRRPGRLPSSSASISTCVSSWTP